jgi:hypothetical protein
MGITRDTPDTTLIVGTTAADTIVGSDTKNHIDTFDGADTITVSGT